MSFNLEGSLCSFHAWVPNRWLTIFWSTFSKEKKTFWEHSNWRYKKLELGLYTCTSIQLESTFLLLQKRFIKHDCFLNPGTLSASHKRLIVSMPHFAVRSQAALRHPSLSKDCSSCHLLIPQQNEWLPYTMLPVPSWLFHLSEALSSWYTTWVHMWGAAETRLCRRLMRFPPCRDGAQYGLSCKLIWAGVWADMVCFGGVVVLENSNRIHVALSNSCFGNLQ